MPLSRPRKAAGRAWLRPWLKELVAPGVRMLQRALRRARQLGRTIPSRFTKPGGVPNQPRRRGRGRLVPGIGPEFRNYLIKGVRP